VTTTLLGVDDSKTMRKVIEITFAGEDFRTVLAENADDAMSKLHADRPSVVLVDAGFEGNTGYDLCQRLKSAAPGVGVLLLSSKQQPYDRARGTQAGADDFIDKPFDTQQLIDKVGTLLRRLAGGPSVQPAAAVPHPAPLTSTAHGLGPAQSPPAVMQPSTASMSRPAAPDLAARPRTATLAYGQVSPMSAGPGPVAPVIPAPMSPAQRSSPVAAPAPVVPPAAVPYAAPAVARPAAPSPAPAPAAPVAAALAGNGADFSQKLSSLGLTAEQVNAVLALSREIVEKVVWEVVPTLAETMIKEEIQRLTAEG
jgi:DNA-binding response OmpR family regulator